jgi:hypothetical protein
MCINKEPVMARNRSILWSLSSLTLAGSLLALAPAAQAGDYERFPEFSNPTWQNQRADVRGQAVAALRAGEVGSGDYQPSTHWSDLSAPGLTRVQVAAEAREAVRLGVARTGDLYVPPTPQQELQIRLAGQRAVEAAMAQAAR